MVSNKPSSFIDLRYQADERPPPSLTFGLGVQLAVLCLGGIVLTPSIVIRAANGSGAYIAWAVFAAVVISGITTVIQAYRWGRIGAGYVLCMGTSGAFIAVSITAINQGGPAMLATLVVISSLFQFALAARLALFRRIFTPTVSGTVIMLIPVTIMPIIYNELSNVPEGTSSSVSVTCASVTIVVILGIALKSTGIWRFWAPVMGVLAGTLLAVWYGIYDTELVAAAAWFGIPKIEWPGFDLSFEKEFWLLLPAFILVTMVGAIETIGDAVAIQRVSWRHPRAMDYRSVQGAVGADGLGNLLSGLAGTVPNTTYSSSVSVVELTGVASRYVGVVVGVTFLALALIPKVLALVLAIPGPVVAAYLTVILSMLFVLGMKVAVQGSPDYRRGLIAGVAFWIGFGFQNEKIFPEFFSQFAGGIFQNGMTAGGLTAILLTLVLEGAQRNRHRLEIDFELSSLPGIREFLHQFAVRRRWNPATIERLEAVSEEALVSLLEREEEKGVRRRLLLVASQKEGEAVLEFAVGASSEENFQDRIELLDQRDTGTGLEREMSLRILQHLASSIHHQQYYDIDILTLRVKLAEPGSKTKAAAS